MNGFALYTLLALVRAMRACDQPPARQHLPAQRRTEEREQPQLGRYRRIQQTESPDRVKRGRPSNPTALQ